MISDWNLHQNLSIGNHIALLHIVSKGDTIFDLECDIAMEAEK